MPGIFSGFGRNDDQGLHVDALPQAFAQQSDLITKPLIVVLIVGRMHVGEPSESNSNFWLHRSDLGGCDARDRRAGSLTPSDALYPPMYTLVSKFPGITLVCGLLEPGVDLGRPVICRGGSATLAGNKLKIGGLPISALFADS